MTKRTRRNHSSAFKAKVALDLMAKIDKLHLELPFAGSRMLRDLLAADGSVGGRRHVRTLMRKMLIEAVYRRNIRDVGRPDVVRTIDCQSTQEIWIDRVPLRRLRGVGPP